MIISYNQNIEKFLKISLIATIIITFVFLITIIIFKYEIEGENKRELPYVIDKITAVSIIDANKNNDENNIWNLDLLQSNDIYIKIIKNKEKDEKVKNVTINNIKMNKTIGEQKIQRLVKNKYIDENLEKIEFMSDTKTNLEELIIDQNGGTIGFRYVIEKIGKYISNEDEVTYNNELLKKANINQQEIKTELQFDIIIELENNVKYKTNIVVNLPIEENKIKDIDINKIIFKRILQK